MFVHIFLLCYNEERMLPHTLKHYKTNFPNAIITLFDNHSTDRSVEIAKEAGCNVAYFSSSDQQDEQKNDLGEKLYVEKSCRKGILGDHV